ncbi:MAG TPA: glycosyltransferase family 4 protein [Candidatus Thermoplasmatota archaeon]|nr:glycosyltransferase family 4 protein [Candidatus Thermoplasmatota archaeon]
MAGRVLLGPMFGEFGGVSQHVRQLDRRLAHEHEAFRLPPWSVYHPVWSGLSWRFEAARRAAPDPFALALSRKARAFDLVHLHAFPFWIRAHLRKSAPRAKTVATLHQIFFEEDFSEADWPRWRAVNESVLESLKDADRVIAVAKWHVPLLRARGIEATWIPNGADVAAFAAADGARFRAKHGLDEPFYLWAAALLRYKRPNLFLDLADRYPDRRFVMMGRGVTPANLHALTGRAPPDNVLLLGEVPRADVMDAFAAARAYVLPSSRETFAIAVLEAMAAGCAVVAARGTGASDILTDGQTGFLFSPDDADDLARAADRAWDRPEVGEAARDLAERHYAWDAVVARIDALYDEVLSS